MPSDLTPCVYCNKGARKPIACPHCWSRQTCCSQRCLLNHIKVTHPKQAAEMASQEEEAETERESRRREQRQAQKERAEAEAGMRVECGDCGALLSIPRRFKGQTIPCPHCGVMQNVPVAELLAAPEEPPEPFWTKRRLVLGCTFWSLVLSCCFGVPGWIYHAQKPRVEANRMYDEGRKAEAVAKYQEMWERLDSPPDMLKRIVEYHLETKNEAEATRWVEKGLDKNVAVNYDTPAAKALHDKVKAKREAKLK